jgi:hypothetical protein
MMGRSSHDDSFHRMLKGNALGDARCFILDQRLGDFQLEGVEIAERLRPRVRVPILLSSGDPLENLPASFDGRIEKKTYRPAELDQVLSGLTRS